MIGAQLGDYLIRSELGSGSMGKVYRADGPEGAIALKVIHPHLLASPGFFKRFLREAEIGRRVEHENVVRTLDCDQLVVDGTPLCFLVMEYVEGQTLRDLQHELGRVPEELCRHIGREVAKGLGAIHEEGIVHRDLKPENVLITREHVVKVMDLGVARLQDAETELSQPGSFVGSVLYAAPEQFGGLEPDGRLDFYALGLILYELSTGQHPSRADDFASIMRMRLNETSRPAGQVNPQLSPYFEEVVSRLLETDREQRLHYLPEEESEWWRERSRAIRVETRRPLRRVRIPRETALYGRDTELSAIRKIFEKVTAGAGQVVLLEGEAGVGKTRLIDEFVAGLDEEVNFLFGSYPPGGAATAAGAFSTAYREQFGAVGSADYLVDTPLLVPAFDALLRGAPNPKGEEPLTKVSLQTVFVEATRALAAERPTIVLIDDLHFAPEEGRALFAALSLALPEHRILLIGTARPELPEDWVADLERQPHAARLALARLGPKDLVQLLADSFGSPQLAQELAGQIALKSDGNPFFAFEIVRGLREGQFIAQRADGTWVTTRVIHDIQVPSSVQDLVKARISGLAAEERDLLDLAACCGFEFDPVLIAESAGVPRIPALKRFAQIERRHRLVNASGPRYVFDHHQVQEALYGSLPEALRREYHTAIAKALEQGPEPDGALCVEICSHHLRGVSAPRARDFLDRALNHLESGYLNDQAIALADRALAAPRVLTGDQRAHVLLRKCQRLDLLGRREEQGKAIDEAAHCAGDSVELSMLLHRARGVLHYRLAQYGESVEEYERSRAAARELGDRRGEAVAGGNRGLALMALGRFDEARSEFELNLDIARDIKAPRIEANATGNLGNVLSLQGRPADALGHYERWLELASAIGDRQGIANATGNVGLALRACGRHEEARPHLERSRSIARDIGDRLVEANAAGNLGNVATDLGYYASAIEEFERCLSVLHEIGGRQGEAIVRGALGNVHLALGSYEEALVHHESHLDLAREIGNRQEEGYALHVLGLIAEQLGDPTRAEELLLEALAVHRNIDFVSGVAEAQAALGRVLGSRGTERREEALRLSREFELSETLLQVTAELAAEGAGALSTAVEAYRTHRASVSVSRRMAAGYRLWQATGDRAYLEEARSLLDQVVQHAPEDHLRSVKEAVSLHRDILHASEGPLSDSSGG